MKQHHGIWPYRKLDIRELERLMDTETLKAIRDSKLSRYESADFMTIEDIRLRQLQGRRILPNE